MHASGLTMLTCISMQNLIKIYHMIQEVRAFSLTSNGQTGRQTDSHSDYSAHLRVVPLRENLRNHKAFTVDQIHG